MEKVKVGLIGCGRISSQYLDNLVPPCNDPNMFGGPIFIERFRGEQKEVALTHYYDHRNRGLGIADMAYAIRNNRLMRASGALMYHVHDIIHAIQDASQTGKHITLESQVERPEPFQAGFRSNIFT